VRSYDFVGRYGGEEFFIAFPGSNRESICERAEAIRKAICREPVRVPQGDIPITLSVGAAVATGDQSISDVLAIADVGLYKAKESGRNLSVICAKPSREFFECSLTQRERCGQCEAGQSSLCVISEKVA
jgi:diguanylate cyclase (GGDEF)-like protein